MGLLKAGNKCPNCNRAYTEKMIKESREIHISSILKGQTKAREAGKTLGRPRSIDYKKVYKLRSKGLSIAKTAQALGVSRGSVLNAIKIKNQPTNTDKE